MSYCIATTESTPRYIKTVSPLVYTSTEADIKDYSKKPPADTDASTLNDSFDPAQLFRVHVIINPHH